MSKSNPRGDSFECLRDAILIRKKVAEVMKYLSLQSQRRVESLTATSEKASDDKETAEKIREENFVQVLVTLESTTLHKKAAELTGSLRTANTIYPDAKTPYALAEANERRLWMDRALGACNALQDELQFIAEAVYADKNKFTALVLDIETLFNKIKSVRQADNRFLRNDAQVA